MEGQNIPLELTNDQLKTVAIQYRAILEKATQLMPSVDQNLLAGTPGTIYLKQKGHRALSEEDRENIIRSLGSEEDKQTIIQFDQARLFLSDRLKKHKYIVLISEQSGIPYLKTRRRIAKPELWSADEMIQIAEVLQRLQV